MAATASKKKDVRGENTAEMADIDRIIDEKGRGKRKQYLCTWMDGAPPQWVEGSYLQGTVALDEWKVSGTRHRVLIRYVVV